MVDKIKKAIKKMSEKEIELYLLILKQLKINYQKLPNLKKLSNKKNLYRVRFGRYRLIFKHENKKIEILKLQKRDDNTYKNL